jgi:prepilin-type processing-associated H-X9-DG protein
MIKAWFCPSDTGPQLTQSSSVTEARARGNYRGCVGPGNMYADVAALNPATDRGANVPAGPGVFTVVPDQSFDALSGGPGVPPAQARMADMSDGTANTVMISEGINPIITTTTLLNPGGMSIGDVQTGVMGGALFSCWDPPNAPIADAVFACPSNNGQVGTGQNDTGYRAPCLNAGITRTDQRAAARSKHSGGVNAAMGDASVRFVSDSISVRTWRSMGGRGDGQVLGSDF